MSTEAGPPSRSRKLGLGKSTGFIGIVQNPRKKECSFLKKRTKKLLLF
jgi:hypothetical protein